MADVGNLSLTIAWALALYATVIAPVGAYLRRRDFVASAEHAALSVWALGRSCLKIHY